MYDESIDVLNAKEVKSPSNSEEENIDDYINMSDFAKVKMRQTSREEKTLDSSDSEPERFIKDLTSERKNSPDMPVTFKALSQRQPTDLPRTTSIERSKKITHLTDSSENSDSDSHKFNPDASDLRLSSKRAGAGVVIPAESAYDPLKYQDLEVSPDLDNLFQHILRYTPQKIDIEFKLQPFIPEYIPAVGDIDAFIKINTPNCNLNGETLDTNVVEYISNLGLNVLDEPAAEQSDSALLHLQLRALSKTNNDKSTMVIKKLENAERNSKAIDRWIKDVSELHLSKPAPTLTYTTSMPDLDSLMEEWPEKMEETLNNVGFPPATLDCSLTEYIDLLCNLFDIPVPQDNLSSRIQAVHLMFTLYLAVKNSQIYADRQKEAMESVVV